MIEKDRMDRFCWGDSDLVIVKPAPEKKSVKKEQPAKPDKEEKAEEQT